MKFLILITALLLAPFAALARAFMPCGADANNVAGSHAGALSRLAEAAIGTPHLALKFGTNAATQVNLCGATDYPVGLAYDPAALGGQVGVERLMDGETKVGIASKAIAAGVAIYTTAGGKFTDTAVNNSFRCGRSLTAAAVDGDEFEFLPESPVLTTV